MKASGFTLIELLITLTLLGILLALAIPNYQTFITSNRLITQVNQLVVAINFARSEAIKRHTTVTLCASNDGKKCDGFWNKGQIIFIDATDNGQVDTNDKILRIYSALPNTVQLEWRSLHKDYLQMSASGGTHGQDGTFIYSSTQNPAEIMKISVSQTGRVRIEKN